MCDHVGGAAWRAYPSIHFVENKYSASLVLSPGLGTSASILHAPTAVSALKYFVKIVFMSYLCTYWAPSFTKRGVHISEATWASCIWVPTCPDHFLLTMGELVRP